MELEPLYQQAFRLLHSRRDDSTEKLKKKLFEVMGRRYEAPKEISKPEISTASNNALDIQLLDNNESLDAKVGHHKQIRHSSDAEMEARSRSSGAEEVVIDDAGSTDKVTQMEVADIDADDFAFDMGIACVVCRLFEVSSNNQLVECQECHSLYHQLCHKPAVTEQEVNDPRSVWYCARCSKTMKKLEKSSLKPAKSQASNSKDNSSGSKSDGSSSGKQEPAFFRRLDSGKHQSVKESGGGASSKPYSGLAGLAANLSGKAVDRGSSSSAAQKDDKGSKDAKRPAVPAPAAETTGGTVAAVDKRDRQLKQASAGGNGGETAVPSAAAAQDKATVKKAKTGLEKLTKHERREADSSSMFASGGKDDGGGRGVGHQQQHASKLASAATRESGEAAPGGDDRKSKMAAKSVAAVGSSQTRAGSGQQQQHLSAGDKAQQQRSIDRDETAQTALLKDESAHKHKVKRVRKE